MKFIFLILTLFILTNNTNSNDSCEVINFYESVDCKNNLKTINNNKIIDVETLLIPYEFNDGVYNIEITQIADNIYKINNTEYYIETERCYNNAYNDDAILKIEFGEIPKLYFNIDKIN